MLPVALPVILPAVRASTAILTGTPQEDWIAWPQILVVVDLIYLVMCFLLFEYVIEE
jgi:heme exporter protein B